jgi:zinc and cadmium transporter
MTTVVWIVVAGVAMSALAFIGAVTLLLPRRSFDRLVLPLVAVAAGSLLGGALFHMLPAAVAAEEGGLAVWVGVASGVLSFVVLEQFLHWHHCHRSVGDHEPVGYLVLVADGLHNFIGGLAVGGAFVLDIRLGVVTWLVAAAHEIPQELGDFGILVNSGWRTSSALIYNAVSALPFLAGGLVAYALAGRADVALLVPFAAGNFIYIALADLLPQMTSQKRARDKVVHTASFAAGLGLLYFLAVVAG